MRANTGVEWCPETESNRHVLLRTRDFKSRASASFAIRAACAFNSLLDFLSGRLFECSENCSDSRPVLLEFCARLLHFKHCVLHRFLI
jgi:hypothetical protein